MQNKITTTFLLDFFINKKVHCQYNGDIAESEIPRNTFNDITGS